MDHNGPFWPVEVYFGPFRSTSRTLATPETKCSNSQIAIWNAETLIGVHASFLSAGEVVPWTDCIIAPMSSQVQGASLVAVLGLNMQQRCVCVCMRVCMCARDLSVCLLASDSLCSQAPRVPQWKNFMSWLVEFAADFSWNFLRPIFLEIEWRKSAICFATSFAHVGKTFRLNFALGAFQHNDSWKIRVHHVM